MKFRITMKTPDAVEEACKDAYATGCDETLDELMEIAEQWFSYGEYLTVEIDTKANTIRVLEA